MAKSNNEIPVNIKLNLSVAEACAYTGIGENTLRKWASEPDCPFAFWLTPRKLLIRRQELEEFLHSKRIFSEE